MAEERYFCTSCGHKQETTDFGECEECGNESLVVRRPNKVTIMGENFHKISGNVYISEQSVNPHNPENASYNVVIVIPDENNDDGFTYIVEGRIIEDIGIGYRVGNREPYNYYEDITVAVYAIIDALGLRPHFFKREVIDAK